MKRKGFYLLGTMMGISMILSACFQGEQSIEEMDPPQEEAEPVDNLEGVNSTEETEDQISASTDMIPRELYLLDKNGMVASQTLELPETNEVASQVLEYLIKDGPISEILPNGFQAVLPAGTEILGLDLQADGTLIVDLSGEFKDYQPEEEVNILEAVTFTLTQFENVNKVKLRMNGESLNAMPVAGTPIGNGYSRANGINVAEGNAVDLLTSKPVTMYYPQEHNESRYYIPVTQYVEADEQNEYASIVQALIEGPGIQANVQHVFNSNTMLLNEPKLNEGVLELVFNQEILKDEEQYIIADDVMETIVRTLSEQEEIEAVDIKVENVDQLVSENGQTYDEPVSTQQFSPTDQL